MPIQFYNPNVIGKQATPEGHIGPNANVFLPYRYWFASGRQITFLTGELPQRRSRILNGTTKPDTFRKDASDCPLAL